MFNWLNPLINSLVITESLIHFLDDEHQIRFNKTIEIWKRADNSRENSREYLRLFGEGLAEFLNLPKYIKDFEVGPGSSAYGTYTRNALMEAMAVANNNKIRVQFDITGPVFQ
jgi:hypothetical protein